MKRKRRNAYEIGEVGIEQESPAVSEERRRNNRDKRVDAEQATYKKLSRG